jgi:hypothetical protein
VVGQTSGCAIRTISAGCTRRHASTSTTASRKAKTGPRRPSSPRFVASCPDRARRSRSHSADEWRRVGRRFEGPCDRHGSPGRLHVARRCPWLPLPGRSRSTAEGPCRPHGEQCATCLGREPCSATARIPAFFVHLIRRLRWIPGPGCLGWEPGPPRGELGGTALADWRAQPGTVVRPRSQPGFPPVGGAASREGGRRACDAGLRRGRSCYEVRGPSPSVGRGRCRCSSAGDLRGAELLVPAAGARQQRELRHSLGCRAEIVGCFS